MVRKPWFLGHLATFILLGPGCSLIGRFIGIGTGTISLVTALKQDPEAIKRVERVVLRFRADRLRKTADAIYKELDVRTLEE